MGSLNGSGGRTRRFDARPVPAVDPFQGVLSMGPQMPVAVVIGLALMLHAGAAAGATAAALFAEIFSWNRGLTEAIALRLGLTYDIEMQKPPPEPEKEEPREEPKEEPKPVVKEEPKAEPPPPPPAAAQAAQTLAQDGPPSNDPLDFTMAQGKGDTYAGGTTQADGTSKTAVYNAAAVATGVPGGTGTAPAPPPPPKVDRSRAASLSGSTDWDCPFPAEADAEQIDQAYVTIHVKVRADGAAEVASIIQDPGHGFGREARKCAMRKRYTTALDVDGNPVAGSTKPIRVHFQR